MAQKRLNPEQQTFVVQALACFDSPSTVAAALKAEFGIELSRQSVEAYDPTKYAGRELSKKLRALFEATRKRFLDSSAEIGIANRSVRLRMLDRMATRAENIGAMALAAQLAEQAAKEVGDVYTNKQKLEHTIPQANININLAGKAK